MRPEEFESSYTQNNTTRNIGNVPALERIRIKTMRKLLFMFCFSFIDPIQPHNTAGSIPRARLQQYLHLLLMTFTAKYICILQANNENCNLRASQ